MKAFPSLTKRYWVRLVTRLTNFSGCTITQFLTTSYLMLGKCCVEVSKSLEDIFYRDIQTGKEKEVPIDNYLHHNMVHQFAKETSQDDVIHRQEMKSSIRNEPNINRRRRRSSLGSLAQFVRRNSAEIVQPVDSNNCILANEAAHKFQFRSP